MRRKENKLKSFIVVLSLAFVMLSNNANSQISELLSYGPNLGYNGSYLYEQYNDASGVMMSGFSVGGFVQYKFLPFLSASFEPSLIRSGASNVDLTLFYAEGSPIIDYVTDAKFIMYSVELPVLATLKNPESVAFGDVEPKIILGPTFGIPISAKTHVERTRHTQTEDIVTKTSDDIKERVESYDIGGVVGFGVDIDVVSIDLRYRIGMTSISNIAGKEKLFANYISLNLKVKM